MRRKTVLLGTLLIPVSILTVALAGVLTAQSGAISPVALDDKPGFLGIAARYPGDVGIEQDPAVVFTENFEHKAPQDLPQVWTSWINPDSRVMKMVEDSTAPTPGKRTLQMTGTKGHDTGGDLWLLMHQGYDQLYARFYCKFATDAPYVHHFVSMSGRADTLHKYPIGQAGIRPTGTDRFGSALDLGSRDKADPPGAWQFYSYWPEMQSWQTPEGVPDGRPNPYYGNEFGPVDPLQAKRGEWQCVEFMIKLNDPDQRNGEQAFWIDGKLIERYAAGTITGTWFRGLFRRSGFYNTDPQPFEGFRWRTTEDLKINIFRLQYYLAHVFENDLTPSDTTIPYNDDIARVQFDNVVLATEYIGPVAQEVEMPGGDYDGNGQSNLLDVIRLIRFCMSDPPDARADYNGDGYCNITDALSLLLDIIGGKA